MSKKFKLMVVLMVLAFVFLMTSLHGYAASNDNGVVQKTCFGGYITKRIGKRTFSVRNYLCGVYDSNGKIKKNSYTGLSIYVPAGTVITISKVSGGWIYPRDDTNTLYLAREWTAKK